LTQIESKEIDKITPEGLIESEEKFIKDLRDYLRVNKTKFKDYEIYILRNCSKSGQGFRLKWSQFFPDFILWVKEVNNNTDQTIVFIEPHGLVHADINRDPKIKFASSGIKEIEQKLSGIGQKNIKLKCFLLSATKYEDLRFGKKEFPSQEEIENKKNVLFIDDPNWPEKLFKKIGVL